AVLNALVPTHEVSAVPTEAANDGATAVNPCATRVVNEGRYDAKAVPEARDEATLYVDAAVPTALSAVLEAVRAFMRPKMEPPSATTPPRTPSDFPTAPEKRSRPFVANDVVVAIASNASSVRPAASGRAEVPPPPKSPGTNLPTLPTTQT